MTRTFPVITLASVLALGFVAPAPLVAQPELVQVQWGTGRAAPRDQFQRAYNQGYSTGLREGEHDARDRRRRDARQHPEFRRGARGWGNGGAMDDAYRRGFVEGYHAGVDRYYGSGYPGGGYGYPQRPQGGYGYPGGGYGYPQRPQGGYGYPGGGYGSGYAAQRGLEDGYREGAKDARDRDRYEPTRKKRYRDGDSGYNRRYGSREQYKQEYREAFRQGYDRGYREGRWR
jgi:hypothetical protein